MATNAFVLALDEHNERILRDLPDAEGYPLPLAIVQGGAVR